VKISHSVTIWAKKVDLLEEKRPKSVPFQATASVSDTVFGHLELVYSWETEEE
jgi:hypothetical protein